MMKVSPSSSDGSKKLIKQFPRVIEQAIRDVHCSIAGNRSKGLKSPSEKKWKLEYSEDP